MNQAAKGLNGRFAVAVLICGALTAAFGLGVGFGFGGPLASQWVGGLGKAVAALLASVLCLLAARRQAGRVRVAWALFGGSSLAWFGGQAVRSYYELGPGQQLPFPSPADAGFLGAALLGVAGVFVFAATQSRNPVLATLLDGAIITSSLIAVSWVVLLEPVYLGGGDTMSSRLISLAYPMGDIVMLSMLILLIASRVKAPNRAGLLLLAAGLLANILVGGAFTYLTAIKGITPATSIDAVWVAGYLLIALAGLRAWSMPASDARSQDQRMTRWRVFIPYVAVAGAVAASLAARVLTGSVDDVLLYDLMVIVVLVAVRQFLTLSENRGLNSALREQTAALHKREEQLRSLVEHSSDAATLADRDGVIHFQSGSVQRMFAYAPGELVGTRLVDLVFPADRPAVLKCLEDALKASARPKSVNSRIRHKLGSWTDCEITITNLLYLPSVEALVINVRDISERKLLEEKVIHQADHDSLTNLANRSAFRRALEKAVDGSALLAAILLIDLDDFKGINLALGSDLGDQLLAAVAARLEQNAPPGALAARLRSDEFAILLPGTNITEAEALAERILEQFRAPFPTPERNVILPVSIGVAAVTSGQETASELLRNADLALQAAKGKGKAKYQRFDPAMRQTGRAEAA